LVKQIGDFENYLRLLLANFGELNTISSVTVGIVPASSGGIVPVRLKLFFTIIAALLFLNAIAVAQNNQPEPVTTFCTFQDGNEVSLRYVAVEAKKSNDPSPGKVWTPGGVPILLFTPTEIVIGNSTIPTGAYSVYPIRNKNDMTLVVNKNVTQGSSYDSGQDLTRANMETAKLPTANKPLAITLGHTSAKVCSLQLVYADLGSWLDIKQK
jgi:hypothetical protein